MKTLALAAASIVLFLVPVTSSPADAAPSSEHVSRVDPGSFAPAARARAIDWD